MNFLFVHQNFPGQFKHLAPALVRGGHRVVALTLRNIAGDWQGVRIVRYGLGRGQGSGLHPWLVDLESKVIRAEGCLRAALALEAQGFVPDVIIAHPGWGESLFLKEVWPHSKLGIYCEYFYRAEGGDVGFDPEFSTRSTETACRVRLKNLNNLAHFQIADAGLSPTQWQADTFPEDFRGRITVAHDGIDTTAAAPDPLVRLSIAPDRLLTRDEEVITFVSRNLEPHRGYHVFIRALPEILARRPNARVLIVGGDDVSYGPPPPGGQTWKQLLADEVRGRIDAADWKRIHFLGKLPYRQFIELLQVSTVHVYLTYPFVLSWSLLEAMSVSCAIVASDTAPVREVLADGKSGRLVDFFDTEALQDAVCKLLDSPVERRRLGANARATALERFDLKSVCLAKQLAWVHGLAAG
jgi:glycosyltransferase involved in cell wall biosynthesis